MPTHPGTKQSTQRSLIIALTTGGYSSRVRCTRDQCRSLTCLRQYPTLPQTHLLINHFPLKTQRLMCTCYAYKALNIPIYIFWGIFGSNRSNSKLTSILLLKY